MSNPEDVIVDAFKLTRYLVWQWMSVGTALFLVSLIGVAVLHEAIHGNAWMTSPALDFYQPWIYVQLFLGFIILPIATFGLHEWVHGLAFRAFGGTPHYGVGMKYLLPYAYATAPGQLFSRNAFLVIALAPLIVLNSLALLLLSLFPQLAWLGWVVVLNTSGAIGDLWTAATICRYPASVKVEDRESGFAIYASQAVAGILPPPSHRFAALNKCWQVISLAFLFVVLIVMVSPLLMLLLDLLHVPPFQLSVSNWVFLTWERTGDGFGLSLNPWAVGAIASLLSVFSMTIFALFRRKSVKK